MQNHNTFMFDTSLLITSVIVTRFGNTPINSTIMTWNKLNVPDNWTELRAKWWSFHIIRAVTSFLAFCLIVWTCMRKD